MIASANTLVTTSAGRRDLSVSLVCSEEANGQQAFATETLAMALARAVLPIERKPCGTNKGLQQAAACCEEPPTSSSRFVLMASCP
jgi:hypothetical protein